MAKEGARLCHGCMSPLEEDVCPFCGYDKNSGFDKQYIKPGETLSGGRYLVGRLARRNGEAAVYIGYDNKSREACWIREYFPTTLARRDPVTGGVVPVAGLEAQYKALISDFVDICNEVRRLSVTEQVIPIRDMVYEKNTVYAVYDKLDVITFEEYLLKNGGKLPLLDALDIMLPFCNMLINIHDHGLLHRGISPYTVYVDCDDQLYLWDFSLGAARTGGSELRAELFNGYSAPEQYVSNGWQGAFTDVYALAALFYRVVSGFVPPKSTLVGEDRPLAALDELVDDIPGNISDAVRKAMAISAEKRTQTVAAFTASLIDSGGSNTAVYDTSKTRLARRGREKSGGGFKYLVLALIFTVALLAGGLWLIVTTFFPGMVDTPASGRPVSSSFVESKSEREAEPEPQSSSIPDTRVPMFTGQELSEVQGNPEYEKQFIFRIEKEHNKDYPEGVIFDQSPAEGTPMPNRGTVILHVSLGVELIEMPDIVGQPWEDALRLLTESGLFCDTVERYTPGAEAGNVVGTVPGPGEEFDPSEQKITVYVMPEENITDASTAIRVRPESESSKK